MFVANQISNLGALPKDLKPGMDANTAQSASGAPSRLSEAVFDKAPPIAKAGGAGHLPPPNQMAPPTPEVSGYARLNEEGPAAPASTPVGSVPSRYT